MTRQARSSECTGAPTLPNRALVDIRMHATAAIPSGEAMFSGTSTDVGEVLDVSTKADDLWRVIIGCRQSNLDRDRYLDRVGGRLSHRGGDRGGRTTFAVGVVAEALE